MDCRQLSALLEGLTADGCKSSITDDMADHLRECAACRRIFSLKRDLASMDDGCLIPEGFSQNWRSAIRKEAMPMGKHHAISWRAVAAMAATVVFIVVGTLITGSKLPKKAVLGPQTFDETILSTSESPDMATRSMASGTAPEYSVQADSFSKSGGQEEAQEAAKIIHTADFTIATRAFDQDISSIKARAADFGGRIESSSISGDPSRGDTRYAYLTLRVPSRRLDEFILGVRGTGRVVQSSESSQDVSDSYYDLASRLSTQEIKMQRLQALMGTAAELSDLIELESAIADTQYMIDSYKGQLQGYDSRVDEATVNITLYEESAKEASEAKALSIGERILLGFRASFDAVKSFLSDLVVFLTIALPWLVGGAVIIFIIIIMLRRKRK